MRQQDVFIHAGSAQSRLEISVSCAALPEPDLLGPTDPVVTLSTRLNRSDPWKLVAKSEVVPRTDSPRFKRCMVVDYFFEEQTWVRLAVLYTDATKPEPAADVAVGNEMGFFECEMSELASSRASPVKPLTCAKSGKEKPTLRVLVEEMRSVKGEAQFTLASSKLANRAGWFGSNKAYLALSKLREDGNWAMVAKTETVTGPAPHWRTIMVPMGRLCNGDTNRPIRIEVLHEETPSLSKPVGHLDVPVEKLLSAGWRGNLAHPRGKPKTCGVVTTSRAAVVMRPSFVDFLHGGLQLGLCVAIDFTASNGEPSNPDSLHAQTGVPGFMNAYERAITAVGAVLAPYDDDQMFSCFGYGAALPPAYIVSHCFALNGNPKAPGCYGVDGVLAAYRKALAAVRLSGPTCFAPVLKAACDAADVDVKAAPPDGLPKYTILLIITDGTIMDMEETLDQVVRASRLPMSIIIVGVGSADFGAMEALDGDKKRVVGRTGAVARDCVQFVAMQDFKSLASGARLAAEVLAEVPTQVCSYFAMRGLKPPPPIAKPEDDEAPATLF